MRFDQSNLKICRVSQVDAPLLLALASRTFRESHALILPAKVLEPYVEQTFTIEQLERELNDPNCMTLVMADGDVLCGYVMLRFNAPSNLIRSDRPIQLSRLYVLHDWIGQGLGSQLMGTSLRSARLHGEREYWLEVGMHNRRAIEFYHHWGFEGIGCSTTWIRGIALPFLVMARSLP